MKRVLLGAFIGACAGLSVLAPQNFIIGVAEDRVIYAFIVRFLIGFFVTLIRLPLSPRLGGAVIGSMVSLPYAMLTEDYFSIAVGVSLGAMLSFGTSDFT